MATDLDAWIDRGDLVHYNGQVTRLVVDERGRRVVRTAYQARCGALGTRFQDFVLETSVVEEVTCEKCTELLDWDPPIEECPDCGQVFSRTDDLDLHLWVHREDVD